MLGRKTEKQPSANDNLPAPVAVQPVAANGPSSLAASAGQMLADAEHVAVGLCQSSYEFFCQQATNLSELAGEVAQSFYDRAKQLREELPPEVTKQWPALPPVPTPKKPGRRGVV